MNKNHEYEIFDSPNKAERVQLAQAIFILRTLLHLNMKPARGSLTYKVKHNFRQHNFIWL